MFEALDDDEFPLALAANFGMTGLTFGTTKLYISVVLG